MDTGDLYQELEELEIRKKMITNQIQQQHKSSREKFPSERINQRPYQLPNSSPVHEAKVPAPSPSGRTSTPKRRSRSRSHPPVPSQKRRSRSKSRHPAPSPSGRTSTPKRRSHSRSHPPVPYQKRRSRSKSRHPAPSPSRRTSTPKRRSRSRSHPPVPSQKRRSRSKSRHPAPPPSEGKPIRKEKNQSRIHINFSSLVREQIPSTDTSIQPKHTIAKKRIRSPSQDQHSPKNNERIKQKKSGSDHPPSLVREQLPSTDTSIHPNRTIAKKRISSPSQDRHTSKNEKRINRKKNPPTQDQTTNKSNNHVPTKPCSSGSVEQNAETNEPVNSTEALPVPKVQTDNTVEEFNTLNQLPDPTVQEQQNQEIQTALFGIIPISDDDEDEPRQISKPKTPTRPVFNSTAQSTDNHIDFRAESLKPKNNVKELLDQNAETSEPLISSELTNVLQFDDQTSLKNLFSNFSIEGITQETSEGYIESILLGSHEGSSQPIPISQTSATEIALLGSHEGSSLPIPISQTSATETQVLPNQFPSILSKTDSIQPGSSTVKEVINVNKEDCSTQIPTKRPYKKRKTNSDEPKTLKEKNWTINQFITREFIPFRDICETRYNNLLELFKEQTERTNYQYISLIAKLDTLDLNSS